MKFILKELPDDLKRLPWRVSVGRKTAHAVRGEWAAACGQVRARMPSEATANMVVCEQCLIELVTDAQGPMHKFFVGYVPGEVRAKRRKRWRAWWKEHRGA